MNNTGPSPKFHDARDILPSEAHRCEYQSTMEGTSLRTKITYTVTEAAELLGISRSSAYECVRRGEIPSLTLGRRVVIPRRAFEAVLDGTAERQRPCESDS